MSKSDCKVCHQPNTKSVGPSFADVSNKYKGQSGALEKLVKKVREGGSGVWGEVAMAAHPALPVADAEVIVKYILNSTDKTLSTLPVKGEYTPEIPKGDDGKGSVLIRAAFTDRAVTGTKTIPSQTSEEMIVLRNPEIYAAEAPIVKGAELKALGVAGLGFSVVAFNGSYLGFKQIDLAGIDKLELDASAQRREGSVGGTIEIRLDSPTGPVIGDEKVAIAPEVDIAKVMAEMESEKKNAKPGEVIKPRNPFARPPIKIKIKDTEGKHDIYIVFKNDSAKAIEPLLSFSKIKFQQ
ncbi:carbohydrate-binding protein [Dyadobacter frigoris]|nr:carbohydrate-binding protein [Dyadobacter frigoris]